MLERQERIALILLISVLATLLAVHLILGAIGYGPLATPYGEKSREGDLVVLTGRIEKITTTSSGGHLLLEVNGTRVFIPAPASRGIMLQRNDSVRIYGIVQIYGGKKEVVVRDARDVAGNPDPG